MKSHATMLVQQKEELTCRKLCLASDRGAGGKSGNAGGSMRDPGHRRIQNVDAGA